MDRKAAVKVVDEIALAAVDYLNAVLLTGLPHIGKGLEHTVVCHGDGRMPPVRRALYYRGGVCQRIERGKAGVDVKLDALFLGIVRTDIFFAQHYVLGLDDDILVIAAVGHKAADENMVAHLYLVYYGLVVLGAQVLCDADRAGKVGHIKAEHCSVALLELAAGYLEHVALDDDSARGLGKSRHGLRRFFYAASHEHRAVGL